MRLLNQQLYAPQLTTPADVVRHMGAIQAQDYRMMRWAVAMRTKKPSARAFKQDYDSGRIIRFHLMRGTWQLVAGEDYRMMLDLFAEKSQRVINGWMHANKISIPDDEYRAVRKVLESCAEQRGCATVSDFTDALTAQGFTLDKHRLSYHIRMAELTGTLCSGNLHPTKMTYCLTESKVPLRQPVDRDEALAIMATKYFQSRSPATLNDFVWWAGLNIGECRRAIDILADDLRCCRWRGREFYVHEAARTRGFVKGRALLLPPFDEYLIGYKSRDIVLPREHTHRAHNNTGNFSPIVAIDGVVCANWKPFDKQMIIKPFEEDLHNPDIWRRWDDYQAYLKR